MDEDSEEGKIRERIADYQRSAAVARTAAKRTASPEIRDAYLRTAEGFEKLALELQRLLKRSQEKGATWPDDDVS
jgi:hypothetical protein